MTRVHSDEAHIYAKVYAALVKRGNPPGYAGPAARKAVEEWRTLQGAATSANDREPIPDDEPTLTLTRAFGLWYVYPTSREADFQAWMHDVKDVTPPPFMRHVADSEDRLEMARLRFPYLQIGSTRFAKEIIRP